MSAGLLVAVLLASALLEGSGWAGGVGDGNLRLSVTVNGRADSDVRPPEVRVGAWVVKRYRLLNVSEADLHRVRVLDPGAPAGSVRCPAVLPAAEEAECTARFRAVAGRHVHPVRAEGDVPSLRTRLTATARAGYAGVAGALGLTEEVVVATPGTGGGGASATVTYTVTNRGNLPLYTVRVEDPGLALAPGAPDCGGRGGTVAVLAPDTSAFCRTTVRLRPGTYRSAGRASGSDRATTLGTGGERVTAPLLTAGASAVFVVREAPVAPVPRTPAPGAPAAGAPAAGSSAGAAGTPGASAGAGAVPAPGAPGALARTDTNAGTGTGTDAAGRPAAPAAPGAGAAPGAVPPSSVSPGAVPPAPPPGLRRAAGVDDEGFLGRVRRRGREAAEFGVATTLLLLLIPAAVAAALLGSRRK
ncbi:hypothetical protein [Streptomyces sp. NPDC000961]|uniref:hypothetical protein n=1 Tax=Streptomyces sp. NPDC000961 TaxID=3364541 RepID=UPI00367D192F